MYAQNVEDDNRKCSFNGLCESREYETWPHSNHAPNTLKKRVSSLGKSEHKFQPLRLRPVFLEVEDEDTEDERTSSDSGAYLGLCDSYDGRNNESNTNEHVRSCKISDLLASCDTVSNRISIENNFESCSSQKYQSENDRRLENGDCPVTLKSSNDYRSFETPYKGPEKQASFENRIHSAVSVKQHSALRDLRNTPAYNIQSSSKFGNHFEGKQRQRFMNPRPLYLSYQDMLANKENIISYEETNKENLDTLHSKEDVDVLEQKNIEINYANDANVEYVKSEVYKQVPRQRSASTGSMKHQKYYKEHPSRQFTVDTSDVDKVPSLKESCSSCTTRRETESFSKETQTSLQTEDKEVQLSKTDTCDKSTFVSFIPNTFGTKTILINGKSYIILNKLGQGGSSVVYQAFDPRTKVLLAIKCVSLPENDESLATGYLNEIKLLKSLQGSDCVIHLYDYEHLIEKKTLYIVMEKGDTDLSKLIRGIFKSQKKIPVSMIVYYWTEILQTVHCIHEQGIIHSDLKPSNFLLVSGRLKLIDFGIASSVQGDVTSVMKDTATGTFNYMSPEAIQDTCNNPNSEGKSQYRIRFRSDVWSLGCILYSLVYGRTPFQHIQNPWAKMTAITNPNTQISFPPTESCPRVLLDTMKKCLAFDPTKRPTVLELLQSSDTLQF